MKNLLITLLILCSGINLFAQTALDVQEVRHTSFVAMIDDNSDLRLQVATDDSFNNLIVEELVTWGFNPLHVNSDLRIKNLSQNTTYYYRFAYDTQPYSYTNTKSATTWDPPTTSVGLQSDITTYDEITLNWTNDDPSTVAYQIYIYSNSACSGGSVSQYDVITTASTSVTYDLLDFDAATWRFDVYALNSSGEFGNAERINEQGCSCYSAIDFSTFFDDKEIVVGGGGSRYDVKYTDGASLVGTSEANLNYVWTFPSGWEMTNFAHYSATIPTGNGDGEVTVTLVNPCTFTGETSATLSIPVIGIRLDQTISFDPFPIEVNFVDADITLDATASSGLPVSYISTNESVATISGSTVSIVGIGETSIIASQAGNGEYAAAPTVPQVLTVDKGNQTISFNSLSDKAFGDANFDLIATASSGLAVSFSSSTPSVATVSGTTVMVVGVGTTQIIASQTGNSNYNSASIVIQELSINPASQTITFDNLPPKRILDDDFDLAATASSGLSVNYSSSDLTVATVSGNTVSIVGLGSTTITASQSGNTNYAAASNVLKSLFVFKEGQTITFPAFVNTSFGDTPFDLTASSSSGLPVTYASGDESVVTISGNTVTVVGVGSTNITVSQAGDETYSAASNVSRPITVSQASQSITFGPLISKTFGDPNFNLSATATSALGVSYASSNVSVATVSGNTVTIVGAGSTTITASQLGDGNYEAASDTDQLLTVNKASQTITFGSLSSKTFGDATFNLSATASSGLSVAYSSSNTTVASVSGNTVSIVGAGMATITASQAGDTDFSAASNIEQSLTVNQASQVITFGSLTDKTFGDTGFDLSATASSGLGVTYSSSNTAVATVSENTVTIVGAGTTTLSASQAGDINFSAASEMIQSLTVSQASQAITFGILADKTFGVVDFDLTATASSGLSIMYVSSDESVATVSGSSVTIVGAGSTVLTASQDGNTDFSAASDAMQTLTVNKADQTITITSIIDKTNTDPSFDVEASIDSGFGLTYEVSGPANISGTTITLTGAIGTVTVTVSQAGTANYNLASEQITFEVNDLQSQTIAFGALEDKSFGDADFALTATASSGLAVTYLSSDESVATISGSIVTILAVGSTEITASQSGDVAFNAAVDVMQTLTVDKADQVIMLREIDDVLVGEAVELIATTTSGLDIVFDVTGSAALSGNTLTTSEIGTVTVSASQAGNEDYKAAETVSISFEVIEAVISSVSEKPFKVIAFPNPATDWIKVGGVGQVQVKLITIEGRIVLDQKVTSANKINITQIETGLYILQTIQDNIIATTKILIH